MAHTFTNILLHVIFSTKARNPLLDDELKPRLLPYLCGIMRELGATPLSIDGPSDHLHLLLAQPPTLPLADLIRTIKTNSSRWIHENWPQRGDFAWQTGYGAFSVSLSAAEDVKRYIAAQQEHHRHVSFQEEFAAFLKKHGIKYDERYIWE